MFRGRFVAIITQRSQLHLPRANWWRANRRHARKTTVALFWHCCSLAFFSFFFFLSSLCLSAAFSSSSLWPHLSLFPFNLSIFCIPHSFLAPEVSISPPPTLVSTPPRSVLSLLGAPAAMWSRRGSRVTEAGPFGVTSSLSHLRGGAAHGRRVSAGVRVRARVCELGRHSRGQSEVLEDDALDTL